MSINVDISDIFFNTEHQYNSTTGEHTNLGSEAKDTLAALNRLGISVPTTEDLIADFYARI